MQTTNKRSKLNRDALEWWLLAEISLSPVAHGEHSEARPPAELLSQIIRDLGLSAELRRKIEGMILGIAKEPTHHFKLGGSNLPAFLRVFCQRKPAERLDCAQRQVEGGWGCFLIRRGKDFPDDSPEENPRVVELYLYQEGE